MTTTAEIVTFRRVQSTDTAAGDDIGPFLRSTGDMISRTQSTDDTGLWTDHIT
ncbi:MAG: hypothetical protein AAF727_07980 [Pseudomonadota bacterium]